MRKKITMIFALLLCLPILMLTGCGSKMCEKVDASYYFDNAVDCSFFSEKNTRNLTLSDLELKKPNEDFLDCYAQLMLSSNEDNSRTYHLYIDYITFFVYFNESSEFDFNLRIIISDIVSEENVWANLDELDEEETKFEDTYSTKPKENSSSEFKVKVGKVIAVTTGTTITFDLTQNNEIFMPDDANNDGEPVTFKWLIYGLEIHAEARGY